MLNTHELSEFFFELLRKASGGQPKIQRRINQAVYVSATPDEYELSLAGPENIAEQLIRPTGIIDPEIEVRKTEGQIDDVIKEVQARIKKGQRTRGRSLSVPRQHIWNVTDGDVLKARRASLGS